MATQSIIRGTGAALPSQRIDNHYFEDWEFFGKDGVPIQKPGSEIVEKLQAISGIQERRFIGDAQESIDIMLEASQSAIADAGIEPNDLEAIIVAHNAGNMLKGAVGDSKNGFHTVPNLAAMLKNRLGVENYECPSYDILFGCPGWVQGVIQANRLIKAGEAKHVLVVGIEVVSRLLDPHDMDSMLMSDGCGAAIISAGEIGEDDGVLAHATFSHGLDDLDAIRLGASLNPDAEGQTYFKMNGKDVYRYATTWLPKVVQQALDKASLTPRDVDMFFFHQANAKMLTVIARNLMKLYGQEKEEYAHKMPSSISFLGNSSVATVPTLFDLVRKGKIEGFSLQPGQTYVFASVGAGMHCNAVVYRS
ncbi:MAG: 3-oxoacyl-ACP synthase III family protein [Bacteroidia bacterium]